LQYQVFISTGNSYSRLLDSDIIVRFKGYVPLYILIPHIIFMFAFMFFSIRIFISNIFDLNVSKKIIYINYIFLILGGLVFGPITQYYAFGVLWSGFPFGYDLTDNKTLLIFISWTITIFYVIKNKSQRLWIIISCFLTFILYLIPHSILGSELDYSKLPQK